MIAVVHLVWGPFGLAWPRRFLDSYRQHRAGADHDLVILLNSVDDRVRAELEAELEGIEHRLLSLDEPVQDLAAYAEAVKRLEHDRMCFLNSYSTILAPDWLAKLEHALDQPGAGLVGATGSWASLRSAVLNSLFLPNPYRSVIPKRSVTRGEMNAINAEIERMRTPTDEAHAETAIELPRRRLSTSVISTLKSFGPMPEQFLRFPGFPAHHIRTNGFMAERATLAELQMQGISQKMEAYALESGHNSLTRQVQKRGLRTLVVGRDGTVYDRDHWHLSRTFWQGDQEQLMIADNQTRTYANGGLDRRRVLSAFAWGPQMDPVLGERPQPTGESGAGHER
ncbi:MAG TPA: hypothetical protein VK781_09585 [Solirubrobacteraceae bacterium]|jgi:hypothetical protein|nr:hypothetical protein [Solirubrobacteraceae bacterium]